LAIKVLAYDNVRVLRHWLSDALCRLATGGGFSARQLYTDADEVLFSSTRPIILNGINAAATEPDLADRTIVQTLAAISGNQRRLEAELWEEFGQKHPRILGALLTAVAHGLKMLPDVKPDHLPRMADFAVWVMSCEGALWPKGTFMATYDSNINEAAETVLEADPVAPVLRRYLDRAGQFKGSASDLLEALNSITPENQQRAEDWPKRHNALSRILRRIAPTLRKVGVEITPEPTTGSGASS
jgi:hypothetical protein